MTAQGGGITLRGATDKSINWYSGVGWSSSESFNLASGSTFKINGTNVISSSSLGTGVTNSSISDNGSLVTINNDSTISGSLNLTGDVNIVDGTIKNKSSNIISGSNSVLATNTGSYTSAFFNYTIFDESNARAGIIACVWNDMSINFNETTTTDIGDTTDAVFDITLSNEGHIELKVDATANWTFKTMATFL